MRTSTFDPRLRAVVADRRPLVFSVDPGHVRAASAVVRVGDRLWVVQDDALVVADVGSDVLAFPLPPTEGLRAFSSRDGTKHLKPDLEAAVLLPDGRIVLFGSGSTSARERLYVIDGDRVDVVHVPDLYARLRAALGPDVDPNIEGATVFGSRITLFQRGNGAGGTNAVIRMTVRWLVARLAGTPGWEPRIVVRRWALGDLDGAPLTFTDGVALAPWAFVYTASAEASPNTVDDGPVAGSAIGLVSREDAVWTPIVGPDGAILPIKVEGLARGDGPGEWWATTDPDDVDTPSELLGLRLEGPWPGSVG